MTNRHLSRRYPLDLDAWKSLTAHYRQEIKNQTIASLFKSPRNRASKFVIKSGDLTLDFSKNLITAKTLKLFSQLIDEAQIHNSIEEMFSGDAVNASEDRPALHVALRSKLSDQIALNIGDVDKVWVTQEKMGLFIDSLHTRKILGFSGKKITNIVNIGIGGSGLGPTMAVVALRDYWVDGMKYYDVSNGDGLELIDLLSEIDIESSLFIVASKSFTTKETEENAMIAREFLEQNYGERAIKYHFAGISNNKEAMDAFGIQSKFQFMVPEWVGGRFSLCSAMGLSLGCMIGMNHFLRMLEGARRMDMHFRQVPFMENMPMMLALLSIFNTNFLGAKSQAILSYGSRLDKFSDYLQQLHMESLGKSTRIDNRSVSINTGSIIWGGSASSGQHSYFQLMHQGTQCVPIDFILPIIDTSERKNNYNVANCLAQSEALMDGYKASGTEKIHPGNRPSNTILFDRVSPEVLGQLISLYEHKVYVQGVIFGINPFDQFGVEYGKKLASKLNEHLIGKKKYNNINKSTQNILDIIENIDSSE